MPVHCSGSFEQSITYSEMTTNNRKSPLGPNGIDLSAKRDTEGSLPDWFHGLMSRRESEELLKNKGTGTFMITLSQRTFGYVLSYKGKERCRHFVISQLPSGELVVLGDACCHDSLPALIKHYQDTFIEPFGEKLAQSYVKFSEINTYDNFEPSNGRQESALSQTKVATQKNNRGGIQNGQRKQSVPATEDIAPPLPERKCSISNDNEQVYSKPIKEDLYSVAKKDTDVLYSLVKETQISQKNMVKTSAPDVLYSEVKLDKRVPAALGHLHSSTQSSSQEARQLSLDTRTPKLLCSLKDLSECEVLEMKFATSIQTVNSKTITTPFLCGRGDNFGSPFLYSNITSEPEIEDTYEQLPFQGSQSHTDYEAINQISNYSKSSTSTYDLVSMRTSKETTSREFNKKVAVTCSAQDSAYETISRDFSKPGGRKHNIAKAEKPKRFFFGDKKK